LANLLLATGLLAFSLKLLLNSNSSTQHKPVHSRARRASFATKGT
jgi:hypothetical protein